MKNVLKFLVVSFVILLMNSNLSFAQIIEIETFGSGAYPGAPLPSGRTTYNYNAPAQPANFPNILQDGDYVIATNSQQGFVNWASIGDNTTGSGYMFLVNADDDQAGEFYRAEVSLTANTSYDFLTYLVNVNSQSDFDFCTNNQGGLVLPNVTLRVEGNGGAILATVDSGDIPFSPTPEWQQYQVSFTTPAATSSVDVVLINNSVGGCGNDLAIDDITFRVAVTMEAFDDTVTVTDTTNAQSSILLLGSNDTLDGNPLPGTENYTVTPLSSLPSGITLNGSTGAVDIAAGTPQGIYTFEYQVCETTNMYNCDTATATIIVDFPPAVIDAQNDNGVVADSSAGVPIVLNVLDNDTIDGTSPPTDFELSISAGSSLPSGLTFDENTGEVGVLAGAPTGIYSFDYDICELGDPTNCETATVTIDVTNPGGAAFCPIGTSAFPGTYYVVSASGGQNPNRAVGMPLAEGSTETGANSATTFFPTITMDLTGDVGILVPEGEVIQVSLSSAFGTQARAEILMSADGVTYTSLGTTGQGGSVYGAFSSNIMRYDDFTVPAGGARFLQVDHQNQGVRADGVIYGTQCQPGGPPTVQAVDDNGSVADSSTGNTLVLNVIDNDSIDGINPPTDFDLAIAPGSTLPAALSFDTTTGEVSVLQNAPTGTYSFDYEICEQGSTNNCQIATVTIDVTNPGGAAFCPIGTSAFPGTYFVVSATNHPGQNQNAERTVGQPLLEGTNETGNESATIFFGAVTMDLTGDADILVPEGENIQVSLSSAWNTQGRAEILMSADGVTYTSLGTTGQGGSVYGAFTPNIMRYDDFTVPAGGARFLQVLQQNQGVRADGVIYGTQCQPSGAPAAPIITASKSIETYDPNNLGLYSIPGNDVIYTITVQNSGTDSVDDNSMLLIDILPSELSFYNADINDGFGPETDPVIFTDNGSGLTFTYATDVGYSQSTTAPANFSECNYTPVANSYDPTTNYICFNPKGEMLPNSDWSVSFRMRIQ